MNTQHQAPTTGKMMCLENIDKKRKGVDLKKKGQGFKQTNYTTQ